jgi:hypothetical protein
MAGMAIQAKTEIEQLRYLLYQKDNSKEDSHG